VWQHTPLMHSSSRCNTTNLYLVRRAFEYPHLAIGLLWHKSPCRYLPTHAKGDLEGRKCLAVACGWRHSMVVDSEGCVFTWGWGSYGQLGLNGKTCALQPAPLCS